MLLPSLEINQVAEQVNANKEGRHYLVAEVEGRAVGSVTLDQPQRARLTHSGRLGLLVHRDYWGRGIGTLLTAAILDVADNWLNLQRVELGVFAHNKAAFHLYEKFGFEVEGQNRCFAYGPTGWIDNIVMSRLRNVPPRPATTTVQDNAKRPARPTSARREAPVVRPPKPDDVEDMYQLFRHPLVARTTLQMPTQQIQLSVERMKSSRPGLYRYVAELDGRAIGMVTLFHFQNPRRHHAASLGMSVHPDYWNRGVGSALMEAVIDLADNWLNLKRVELEVNVDNPAGVRLYEKYGFEVEATLRYHTYGDGRWADSYSMGRLR
jgi:putative acetyltransferase